MKLFNTLIKEHLSILLRLGFDEKNLQSPYREGWLAQEFKLHLEKAIRNMHYDRSCSDFVLYPVAGQDVKSRIKFDLHYHFDPIAKHLILVNAGAQSGQSRISVQLHPTAIIPTALQLAQFLKMSAQLID
ncbi:hypothetical protein [Chitinophaga arvensicola]|uniref:Uncharacterized protein n=1 Tax=Chitinophaga arvensicola TaxID=29529 RepID=A0A1I0PL92_9BACT|nr:hypothetical protein [Chitinophaga arvensicola]SEW15093.1 hypothetical protein SAMN04488122_0846 [Chitinophaga arvensicola]